MIHVNFIIVIIVSKNKKAILLYQPLVYVYIYMNAVYVCVILVISVVTYQLYFNTGN